MEKQLIKVLKDIDIKAFSYAKSLLFRNRVKVYIVVFLIIFREVMLRAPYLNIIAANMRDMLDAITLPLLLAVIVGFNSRKIFIIAVVMFFPVAMLSLLGREPIAELLSNNIYVLLVIGILGMIVRFVKYENE